MAWDDLLLPAHTTADTYRRITLPKPVSDRIPWMQGDSSIQAWLLLVSLGRYRLLSDEQVQGSSLLEPVRQLILEGKPPAVTDPTYAEELKRAAIVARLAPNNNRASKTGLEDFFPEGVRRVCATGV